MLNEKCTKNTQNLICAVCKNNYLKSGENQVPRGAENRAVAVCQAQKRSHALQIFGGEHHRPLLSSSWPRDRGQRGADRHHLLPEIVFTVRIHVVLHVRLLVVTVTYDNTQLKF
jgi:hypothetical protein